MKKQLIYLLRLGLALGGTIFSVYVSLNYLTQFESMVRADTLPRDSQSNLIKNIQIDEVVAEGFTRPVQVTHAGDGSGRLFVVEQRGKIKIIQDGQVLTRPFLDIQEVVNDGGNEQGLLGLTFHPHYTQTGYFYVNYTDAANATVVGRYSVSMTDSNQADLTSFMTILTVDQFATNHNGGQILFGPDGYLYIGMGDGGGGGDPQDNGQNAETLLGAMLRLDVDRATPYAIPPDNPYVGTTGADEVWAIGLRNPWRFSFDRMTGDLYIGDVGQNAWEEINYLAVDSVTAASEGERNFGWPCREGRHDFEFTDACATLTLTEPIAEYGHDDAGGYSVTGGFVYRGQAYPDWQGRYFYADYISGRIWSLNKLGSGNWSEPRLELDTNLQISAFGEDEAGELYITEFSGKVRRLTTEDVSTAIFATNVIYDVVFESTWRAETHPNNFPAGAHLSGLVGAVHRDTVTFWQRGELASAGIESMAELGGKSILLGEVDQAIAQGHALGRLSGGGIGSSPGSVTLSSFTLNHNFPLVTLVSMIAPSPDWFVGVSGLSLVDEQGAWLPKISVELYPYDAGTDSGTDYGSENADTNPPEPIRHISGEAPFSKAPIGTFTFTLQEVLPNKAPNAPHTPVPQDGSEAVSTTLTLSWQSDDPDQDDLTYTIALDTEQLPALIATGLMTPSYQADNLQANMTYYWQITATDGLSATVGPTWVFTTMTAPDFVMIVDPNIGGLITATDESVILDFPPNVFSETLQISLVTTSNQPPNTLGNLMFAGYIFDLIAQDLQGHVITSFNRLFTLTLNYQQVDWRATGIVNEVALDVYWWDSQHWIALPSQHDPVLDRFIVPLNHLGQFALLAAEERLYLPLILKSLP